MEAHDRMFLITRVVPWDFLERKYVDSGFPQSLEELGQTNKLAEKEN